VNYFVFMLLGLGDGAVYAALALSLIVVYRSSGVINFAAGAMAMYGAYTFAVLRNDDAILNPLGGSLTFGIVMSSIFLVGGVVLPIVTRHRRPKETWRVGGGVIVFFVLTQLPVKISLGGEVPFVVSLTLALAISTMLGVAMYVLVFRQMRTSLPLAKAVASLGVMALLQGLIALRLGSEPPVIGPLFPAEGIRIGQNVVRQDVLMFFATIIAIVVLVWIVFRWTRFGRATAAAAECERGAIAIGISTDRIALANWALAGLVTGLGGILIAPIAQVTPTNFTLFVVPALAAALVGRFSFVWPAVGVATVLGMSQSVTILLRTNDWWPDVPGIAQALPFVIVIGVMVASGRPLPERGAIILQTLPLARAPRKVPQHTALAAAAGVVLLVVLDGGYLAGLTASLVFIPFALSLVVITGYVGQISLAQFAFAGVSALAMSKLTTDVGIPFPFAPVIAALIAAVAGVLVGLPALRVRGINLAVLTLTVAVAIEQLIFRNPDLNGGPFGAPIEPLTIFGMSVSYPGVSYGVFALCVALICSLAVIGLRRSRLGYQMLAVRANERAATAAGINVALVKLTAFGIAAFIAGIAGVVYAYQFPAVSPDSFGVLAGIALFATVYLAGVSSVSGGVVAGAIAGAGLVTVVFNRHLHVGAYHGVLLGLGLVIAALRHPEGVAGAVQGVLENRRKRRGAGAGAVTASSDDPVGESFGGPTTVTAERVSG
jgi:ABC-type branched-subunit amino acid transport system permease subunit